ncbi:MAG: endonuclease [Bacteroidota bacterium]
MKNRLLPLLSIYCLLTLNLSAQIPSGYYNSAQGLTGVSLKTALHNIINNHTTVSYASLWTHFQDTDKKSNGKVWDMYSDIPGGTPPYVFTFSSDQCGSYNGEADCYNREHTWPQSWFNSASGPTSDLFHVYPTDGYVNNMRGNYPYGDVTTPTWTSQNGSKLGPSADAGYSQTVFEPIDEYKGDLARNYFYMSTRYQSEDASWSSSGATNKSVILPWQVDVLLIWNQQDPVSAKEIDRNNAVYQIQNNRNPFIDNPQWADSIWTITLTGIQSEFALGSDISVYPNPANDQFSINNAGDKAVIAKLSAYSILGQEIAHYEGVKLMSNGTPDLTIDCSAWNKGIYYVTIQETEKVKVIKLIKE